MPLVGAARTGVSRSRRRAGGSSSLSSTLPISRCAPSTGRSRVQQKRQLDTQGIDSFTTAAATTVLRSGGRKEAGLLNHVELRPGRGGNEGWEVTPQLGVGTSAATLGRGGSTIATIKKTSRTCASLQGNSRNRPSCRGCSCFRRSPRPPLGSP